MAENYCLLLDLFKVQVTAFVERLKPTLSSFTRWAPWPTYLQFSTHQ